MARSLLPSSGCEAPRMLSQGTWTLVCDDRAQGEGQIPQGHSSCVEGLRVDIREHQGAWWTAMVWGVGRPQGQGLLSCSRPCVPTPG